MAGLMIRPGLERVTRLLKGIPIAWRPVHVAGTNGKGSTCAYLSAMLHACGVLTGRFTSPHLFDRWDCITINERPVAESLFHEVENMFKLRNEKEEIQATSFELLTATAFEIFNRERVNVGVVECGMGGRLDATNVLQQPLVTVITQLGMDHQAFLGNSEHQIAWEKAGIMKKGVPCVLNSFSGDKFLEVIVNRAKALEVPLHFIPLDSPDRQRAYVPSPGSPTEYHELFKDMPEPTYTVQKSNMWCAYRTFQVIEETMSLPNVDHGHMLQVMSRTSLPGRFHKVSLERLTGRRTLITIDGAHNPDAWRANFGGRFHFSGDEGTPQQKHITWVVACSNGRDPMSMFHVISPEDTVIITEFGPVDSMPWVEPVPGDNYEPIKQGKPNWINMGKDILGALKKACEVAREGPIIVAGSLYLAADVLRIVRDAGGDINYDYIEPSRKTPSLSKPGTESSRASSASTGLL